MHELRFAVRRLLKTPGFTAIAVLTLALGIGANSALFGFVNAILLRPLPYPAAERLVRIGSANLALGVSDSRSSDLNIADWQDRCTVFEEIAAFQEWDGAINVDGRSEVVRVNWVTPNLLPMLGIHPVHGRLITATDMDSGLMIPYGLWQRLFAGDPSVLGRQIKADGEKATVVGVLPPEAAAPVQGAPALNQVFHAADLRRTRFPRDLLLRNVVARLKPGMTAAQAQEELSRVAADLEREYPETNRGWGVNVTPLKEWQRQKVRPALLAVYGATIVILLIACLNVSNLLLIRTESRRKELAIRSALGSTTLRLVRQLFSESLLLSIMGAGTGVLVAWWCRGLMVRFAPDSIAIQPAVGFAPPVILSAIVIMVLATLLSAAFPALRLRRRHIAQALVETGRSASPARRRHRLLNGLIVGQIAVSTVLLVATGLAIVSFKKLMRVDPGFTRHNAICFRLDPFPNRELTQRVIETLRSLPGVQSVGGANHELLNDLWSNNVRITVDPEPEISSPAARTVDYWRVTTDYFAATGIPLITGRTFDKYDPSDVDTNGPVRVIVNEALAKQFFGQANPIGRTLRILPREGRGAPREIIGVVGSVKHRGLQRPDVPMIYVHAQDAPALTVRAASNAAVLLETMRGAIAQVDSQLIMSHVFTTEEIVTRSLGNRRFTTRLMLAFAALGILLAALGLYGVTSYAVSQRIQEIGVRMALGAQRRDVFQLVLGRGVWVAGSGIVLGSVGALFVTRGIQSLLFNVSPTDPITFVAVSLLLVMIALLASWLPARRAASINPIEALRQE